MSINNGCRAFVLQSQHHDDFIDGSLSLSYGFMPKEPVLSKLPKYFDPWESIIEEVPALYYQNRTQKLLDNLPLLDANKLEVDELPRAATLLSILASAYWRHGVEKNFNVRNTIEDGKLSASLFEPWTHVCERLGRGKRPYQNCYDLFLKNFLIRENKDHIVENMKIENLDVHVKSFGNEAERVFYMSFVEIHAITSGIVADICDIEDTITNQKLAKQEQFLLLSKILAKITEHVKASISSLIKISPIKSSKTYCDPILWAKTVGVFAIPPLNFVQGGTSGTSVPIVHVLDTLIGRKKYASYYGKYIKKEGEPLLPQVIKEFTKRVDALNLAEWIEDHREQSEQYYSLVESYNNLVNTYAGKQGFLDKHTSKVFNYLGIGTMVGRNQSTSGHQRYINEETWVQVAQELKIAQDERIAINLNQIRLPSDTAENVDEQYKSESNVPDLPNINCLEVAKHYKKDDAWIILNTQVFNITAFLSKHPGGMEIIRPYLGQDATRAFAMITGHSKSSVLKMLETFKIGRCIFENIGENDTNYNNLKQSLKVYGLLEIQIEHEVKAYDKFLFLSQVHNQFCNDLLTSILPFSFEQFTDYPALHLFCQQASIEAFYDSLKLDIDMLLSSISTVAHLDLQLVETIINRRNNAWLKSDLEVNDVYEAIYQEVHLWYTSTEGIISNINERLTMKGVKNCKC
jgi:cytochrome b involved in lipid metabolism